MTPRIRVSDLFPKRQAMEFLSNESQGSGAQRLGDHGRSRPQIRRVGHHEDADTSTEPPITKHLKHLKHWSLFRRAEGRFRLPKSDWRSTEESGNVPKTNVDGERPELLVSIWMNPHKNWLIKSPWICYWWGVFHGQRWWNMVQMWSNSSCWWNVMKRDDTIRLSFSNP